MRYFLVGLLTFVTVLFFMGLGAIWIANGTARNDPFSFVVGAIMLLAASFVVYVIGEAMESTRP